MKISYSGIGCNKNFIHTQKEFLENMGIVERAKIIGKRMKFSDQSSLYFRLKRLLTEASAIIPSLGE